MRPVCIRFHTEETRLDPTLTEEQIGNMIGMDLEWQKQISVQGSRDEGHVRHVE